MSSVNYHFVFVRKLRCAVLVKDVAKRLQEIIFDLVTEHAWKLLYRLKSCLTTFTSSLTLPPRSAPSQIAKWVKGRASHYLRREFGSPGFLGENVFFVTKLSESELPKALPCLKISFSYHLKAGKANSERNGSPSYFVATTLAG